MLLICCAQWGIKLIVYFRRVVMMAVPAWPTVWVRGGRDTWLAVPLTWLCHRALYSIRVGEGGRERWGKGSAEDVQPVGFTEQRPCCRHSESCRTWIWSSIWAPWPIISTLLIWIRMIRILFCYSRSDRAGWFPLYYKNLPDMSDSGSQTRIRIIVIQIKVLKWPMLFAKAMQKGPAAQLCCNSPLSVYNIVTFYFSQPVTIFCCFSSLCKKLG